MADPTTPAPIAVTVVDAQRVVDRLRADLVAAEREAWNGLARMKWSQFGYWAAAWVRDNRKLVGGELATIRQRPSPFRVLADVARIVRAELEAGHGVPILTITLQRRKAALLEVSECAEVAARLKAASPAVTWRSFDDCLRWVRRRMPGESETVISNTASTLYNGHL